MTFHLTAPFKLFINKYIERWLSRRIPSNARHQLTSRNIFIMPSKFGLAYLFFVIILFLLGTNYQNNIIMLVCYLLASLFITVMLHSFYNFSQLIFESPAVQYGFAHQSINFPIKITADKVRFDINFKFSTQVALRNVSMLSQCEIGQNELLLSFCSKQRGVYDLGRVKVYSEYSLGFFTTWAMLDFAHQAVIYPKPKQLNSNQYQLSSEEDEDDSGYHANQKSGIDDFYELKNYVVGEPLSRIAWKQFARGQGKYSKHYHNEQGQKLWLKLSEMPSNDLEIKLSFLCFLVLEHSKNKQAFGLTLKENLGSKTSTAIEIAPDSGYVHQQECLIALARFSST